MRPRIFVTLFLIFFMVISPLAFAQQSDGSLDEACSISGGDWTSTSAGNSACCWADWGCYDCVNGICKIKCHNESCRKANSNSRITHQGVKVDGLAPKGMLAPIAPVSIKARSKQSVRRR